MSFHTPVQTQTHSHVHAGDVLPSSPAVLVEDVDLLRLEGQTGFNPHHATRPEHKQVGIEANDLNLFLKREECTVTNMLLLSHSLYSIVNSLMWEMNLSNTNDV